MSGPSIVSAYLELVGAPASQHAIMDCPPGDGNPYALKDGMSVTFSKQVDGTNLAPEMFHITLKDPILSLNQVVHPECVSLAPADDSKELYTVFMIGEFAGPSGVENYVPTQIEVDFDTSGNALLSLDGDELTGLNIDHITLGNGNGPKMVMANRLAGTNSDGLYQIQTVWESRVFALNGEELNEHSLLNFTLIDVEGNEISPAGFDDLGDGDNVVVLNVPEGISSLRVGKVKVSPYTVFDSSNVGNFDERIQTDLSTFMKSSELKTTRRLDACDECDVTCLTLDFLIEFDRRAQEVLVSLEEIAPVVDLFLVETFERSDNSFEYSIELCPSYCYSLLIEDSGEDGICCEYGDGRYFLQLEDGLFTADGASAAVGGIFEDEVEILIGDGCFSNSPSLIPTYFPTEIPTLLPTIIPTFFPTISPTFSPTEFETEFPTDAPSDQKDLVKGILKSTCFSGDMEVVVQGKGAVTMSALQVGDYVKIGNREIYERVYAFGHREPQKDTEFVRLHTDAATPLEMTGEHLVFVDGKANPIRADSIRVGDLLRAEHNQNAVVEKITLVTRKGIYNPLTSSGTIQVNGITASNYVSFHKENNEFVELQGGIEIPMSHHDLAHSALAPFRFYCTTLSTCDINDASTGVPAYVSKGINLIEWSYQQHMAVQLLTWALFRMLVFASILMTIAVSMIPVYLISGGSIYHPQRFFSLAWRVGVDLNKEMKVKKEN